MSNNVQSILAASDTGFGTSGLRGRVDDLNDRLCMAATIGFMTHCASRYELRPGCQVLIAQDLRPSSPKICAAIVSALQHLGYEAVFCGTIPTPALALESMRRKTPAIMVTGSHIPFDRNGIKFYNPDGEISKADEEPIQTCQATVPDIAVSYDLPPLDPSAQENYRNRFTQAFPNLLTGKRIGLFQHSAVGRDLNKQLLEDLGATVVPLGRSEAFVPIDTEAVAESDRQQARIWSKEHKLDALISTDGDGDRPLLADETGSYLAGDELGILAAHFLRAKIVVAPVSCTTAIESCGWFAGVARTRIGSPHVLATMAEHAVKSDGVVGFEANGGFLTQSDFLIDGATLTALPTRDAMLPALAALALAHHEKITLCELRTRLPRRSTRADRLTDIPTERSKALLSQLEASAEHRSILLEEIGPDINFNTTDGLRMTMASGEIVHLRPSGNAPEFRIYVEAESIDRAKTVLTKMLSAVKKALKEFEAKP